uniref:Uncharacterized protein n=1 Tax=Rhizophora mucronata TaxID=61149 RepID=A0A2P2PUL9_RHIMU
MRHVITSRKTSLAAQTTSFLEQVYYVKVCCVTLYYGCHSMLWCIGV